MSLWIHLKIPNSYSSKDQTSFQDFIDFINENLTSIGLPCYQYNFTIDINTIKLPEIDGSRAELAQLKYVAAMLFSDINWTPSPSFKKFSSNQIPPDLKERFMSESKSHLICNNYGKYVPIDFRKVSLPPRFINSIGSSISLKNELELLANNLNLSLKNCMYDIDAILDEMIDELQDDPLFMSKIMLVRFYNIVNNSIKYNLVICMD